LQGCIQEILVGELAEYLEAEITATVVQGLMMTFEPWFYFNSKSEQ
jgi:hypothetical protein